MRNTKFFLAAAAVFASTPAFAAGDNMVVTANVANACSFNAADTTVSASTIRAGGSTTGNVGIWCTNGYTVTVTGSSCLQRRSPAWTVTSSFLRPLQVPQ